MNSREPQVSFNKLSQETLKKHEVSKGTLKIAKFPKRFKLKGEDELKILEATQARQLENLKKISNKILYF